MDKYLYLVKLDGGRSNPEFSIFNLNVINLNAQTGDYGGINNCCVISHHMDAKTVQMICSAGMEDRTQVTIEEIFSETLNDSKSFHWLYGDLVKKYFLPHGKYPHIK
jgi:hypothetical protein